MDWMALSTIVVNVLTTTSVLLLLGRHQNRRLRYLVLTIGIVSVSQTAAYVFKLQGDGFSRTVSSFQQFVTALASMAAVYLLWREISDRNRTDRMLRLTEHENQVMQCRLEKRPSAAMSRFPEDPAQA